MALGAEDLAAIGAMLEASGKAAVPALRQRFPKLPLTQCDASDMSETPFAVHGFAELYFIDTADHCVTITQDPARATGLILAWKKGAA